MDSFDDDEPPVVVFDRSMGPINPQVLDICNDDPWSPSKSVLNRLSQNVENVETKNLIFKDIKMILGYPPEKWRSIYKALILIEHLIQVARNVCRNEIIDQFEVVKQLESFSFWENGHDRGDGIREKARQLVEIIRG